MLLDIGKSYYSTYGHVEKLAKEIQKGVEFVEGVEAKLWQALAGKPAGIFYSIGSQGGGQETTTLTAITQLTHHGMIFVPIGYTFGAGMFEMEQIKGGSPYGAGTYAGDGPGNSSHRYVGIMYNLPVMTVIWVANTENPINDSSGILQISQDGNLMILDGQNSVVWSSNISTYVANSSAQILDTGNLVLYNSNGGIIWESFLHASDSFVEGMKIFTEKIFTDLSTKERNIMMSWRSPNDPGPGRFTCGIEPSQVPQTFVWKDGYPYWRSGPWNGQVMNGVPTMKSFYKRGLHLVSDHPGSGYLTFKLLNSILIYSQLNASGIILEKAWSDKIRDWKVMWTSKESECDVYGKCGNFGVCYAAERPMCSCFPGFDPRSNSEWDEGNWTSGCTRRRYLQCGRNITGGENDGFLKMSSVKLPDNAKWFPMFETECRSKCLNNCSCIAYAYYGEVGCMMWDEDLIDVQKFSSNGADLYIRLADSELGKEIFFGIHVALFQVGSMELHMPIFGITIYNIENILVVGVLYG
ncbi:hypothetical protein BUALT_Bualt18G0103500 [Buddleja alternifolia]|uniref:Uncharacterized protein n=1 Tax=Buddleja alternifolia TaxID=168488 RepID=A0AAV6W5S5_9LAMI|nr:hypothetical protein BUALT_Bualt18G0103500 [Buddleja alternifolia]